MLKNNIKDLILETINLYENSNLNQTIIDEGMQKLKEEGIVLDFELQPQYILQEGFIKDGKKIQAITYKAEFRVIYANGLEEVIDVKGKVTESFRIKRKLLLYKYRDIDFKCLQEKGRKPNKYWVQIL